MRLRNDHFYTFLALVFLLQGEFSFAQKAPANWYLMSPVKDKVYGTGADRAYDLLKDRMPREIVVAVIDGGTEIDHEDLRDRLWINQGEVAGNGMDDDGNGYVDDVHGWSFLGGVDRDINHEAMELARLVFRERRYFADKDTTRLSAEDADRFERHVSLQGKFGEEHSEMERQYQGIKLVADHIRKVKESSGGEFSKAANKAYKPTDDMGKRLRKTMKVLLLLMSADALEKEVLMADESMGPMLAMNFMDTDSLRRIVVGDDPANGSQKVYGCNRYEGPDGMHGTHVAGIIGASRGNGLGIEGVASNARIMVLRAVPNGDERDKDVANAIRYAVDHGASIVNMSFGKYYSGEKSLVDEAVRYGMSRDVLFVHAAGNESKDRDQETTYPCRKLDDGTEVTNWIEVGASTSSRKGKKVIASFSNYGAGSVDLFAPGEDIWSTIPDNGYGDASGTSMAAPVVSGVAAMIRGYFPELTASEVREVLMATVEPYGKKVRVPGKKDKMRMKDLCISGGFVSAENAVRYLLRQGR